jgi:hypothetical protein
MNEIVENLVQKIPVDFKFETLIGFISSPSFKTLQLALVVYAGLLWLSIIIWVTRDAINRSNSLLFQVFSILLNILFPVLGILLYLIIRPGKTSLERYYEELEHRLILENISAEPGHETDEPPDAKAHKSHPGSHKTKEHLAGSPRSQKRKIRKIKV